MTTEISDVLKPATDREVVHMTAYLRGSLRQGKALPLEEVEEISAKLEVPATAKWISGRAATVLAQYFASPMPDEVMRVIAQDWIDELEDYPAWALKCAFAWWIGKDNPKRRQKPLPGDISERAYSEMAVVRAAKIRAGSPERRETEMEVRGQKVSPEAATAILEKAGFKPKRMEAAE